MPRRKSIIEQTYLISEKITREDPREVDELERVLGHLPKGYREYIERFGSKGEYQQTLSIWTPDLILQFADRERAEWTYQTIADFFPSDVEPDGFLTEQDCAEFYHFADACDGDYIIYLPRFPGALFILPRHEDEIFKIDSGFEDPLLVINHGRDVDKTWIDGELQEDCFRYFQPKGAGISYHNVFLETTLGEAEICRLIGDYWNAPKFARIEEWTDRCGIRSHFVCIKEIGGKLGITLNSDQYIGITYDAEHKDKILEFEQAINEGRLHRELRGRQKT